ncbi:monovalent cation/H(+) antiporter subunit G [Desertibacillus haloalkaliphilus]|uniref:monovalent cation/H(+) antiporter subunit G n=1 Tax=Desertibacillus haloalkaliphilus TaxID=1328930 RepID=UPI001C2700FB|nr:monovalent cation/H(+) antiporter subunit G [Desertibacillus haloalkaliphilus]MBU8905598.1 monovalent cation/H(+) antiporter subunit G [Desertibacillus haloalkaliphilus]
MSLIAILISILAILGGFLSLLGSIGLIRFPDVYGRLHAATKSATLGVISIMLATFLYFLFAEQLFMGKILLTILFVFLTAPVVGLTVSRSAYRIGVPLWEQSTIDELGKKMNKSKKKKKEKTAVE